MHKIDNGYKEWETYHEETRKFNYYSFHKYKCVCGHKVIIPKCLKMKICGWCGRYVFRDKKDEFKYRMMEKLRRINEKDNKRKNIY